MVPSVVDSNSVLKLFIVALHVPVAGVAGLALLTATYPGEPEVRWIGLTVGAFAAAFAWVVCTSTIAVVRRELPLWFVLGSAVFALTMALLVPGLPLQLRWLASRPAFAAVVAGHPIPAAGSPAREFTAPGTVGTYRITRAAWVPGGAFLYEIHGTSLIGDAGFAYLPAGPTAELDTAEFDYAHFSPLGGGWYTFTAVAS
ncbi:hypothetical protein [Dactylosporangium sp. NPDC051541]|uniref:hypothetical protein n=1 Tax=Dactylosporangium sp. NPDC051541 TaxID=3363977 RepID=UPI0037913808